ncbi:MAG: ABC transporter substrate-binding protein [Candidatus Faecivicinus sp.]
MKKMLCLLLAFASLMLSLCVMPAMAEEKTVIEMAVSGSAEEIALREETANLYMEQNPNVEIKWIDLGDDRVTKTLALMSSGEAPDILYLNENIYTYTTRGILEPLTRFIEAEGDGYLDYFYESLLAPLTYEGELYALPQEVSPYVVYYNKTLFDKYGVEYPTNDWTFDDWSDTLVKLAHPDELVYAENIMEWADKYLQHFSRMGVEIYTDDMQGIWTAQPENYDKALAAFEWLRVKIAEEKVCPDPAEVTAMGKGFSQMFRNQQVAMMASGMWSLPPFAAEPLDFEWDVVMAPLSQDGTRTLRAGILNWGICSSSENKEVAWDVLKFFVGHEGQMIVAKYNMALPSAYDDEANQLIIDSGFPESVQNFVDSVEYIEMQDSFSMCEDEINNLLTSQLQAMILGECTAEEALDYFNEEATYILEEALEG